MPRKDPEARREYNRARYLATREYQRRQKHEYYLRTSVRAKARAKAWREANPERYNELNKAWAHRHPEKLRAKRKLDAIKFKDKNKVRAAARFQAQKSIFTARSNRWKVAHPEAVKIHQARSKQKHMGKVLACNAARRARKLNATPPWVNLAKISEFYQLAHSLTQETGVRYSVDHIYPLKGKGFMGLHVPWNLQVITASENSRKGNRLPTSKTNIKVGV